MRTLYPVDLTISAIAVECATWQIARPQGLPPLTAALIRFRGVYRRGSRGADDALFIRWRLDELCALRKPEALVVDLRQLDYEWGDDLSVVPARPLTHLSIVIREEQRAAVAPLLGETELRTDFEATLNEVDSALRRLSR